MSIIRVENLSKVFRITHKDPGVGGAVKGLFRPRYTEKVAVDGLCFTVEPGEVVNRLVLHFSRMIRSGQLAVELLRPVDFQGRSYVETLADLGVDLLLKLPLVLLAIALFGLQLPSDPRVYIAFVLALALGHAVLFFFDWIFACLAFYSTETWGLSVVREGIALFFSGALVPLTLMPDWLRTIAAALPFAQALYVPVSILSGITPLAKAPQILLIQLLWLLGLGTALPRSTPRAISSGAMSALWPGVAHSSPPRSWCSAIASGCLG